MAGVGGASGSSSNSSGSNSSNGSKSSGQSNSKSSSDKSSKSDNGSDSSNRSSTSSSKGRSSQTSMTGSERTQDSNSFDGAMAAASAASTREAGPPSIGAPPSSSNRDSTTKNPHENDNKSARTAAPPGIGAPPANASDHGLTPDQSRALADSAAVMQGTTTVSKPGSFLDRAMATYTQSHQVQAEANKAAGEMVAGAVWGRPQLMPLSVRRALLGRGQKPSPICRLLSRIWRPDRSVSRRSPEQRNDTGIAKKLLETSFLQFPTCLVR